jgi:hypothetical protein
VLRIVHVVGGILWVGAAVLHGVLHQALMEAIGAEIAAGNRPPNGEQTGRLHSMRKGLDLADRIDFVMLSGAILTMAAARSWHF